MPRVRQHRPRQPHQARCDGIVRVAGRVVEGVRDLRVVEHTDRGHVDRESVAERTEALPGPPSHAERRCRHDTDDERARVLEPDERRPDRDAAHVVLGAVDRVDDPSVLVAVADEVVELLADDRVRGRGRDPLAQGNLDGAIRFAHRCEVRLGLDPQIVRTKARGRDRVGFVGKLQGEREMRFHGRRVGHGQERIDPTGPAAGPGYGRSVVSSEDQEFETFLRSYYAQVPAEDLEHRNPDELRAVARCHWDLAQQRAPGTAIVRVFAPKRAEDGWDANHTIVQIVNDDMPFLVDSVTMELERHDLGLHLVVHPIVRVRPRCRRPPARHRDRRRGRSGRTRGDGARVLPLRRGRPRDRSRVARRAHDAISNGCWATCARPPRTG